ncbi:MAG: PepSY domain-containing protein [Reyranella sp.]|nr:PepSY domain-containing protein [Reyranella sp.]
MAGTSKPQRRTFRYWLQQLHLWVGLILLLPLVMMGITGAVLVYAHDIEHLPCW